MRDFERIKKANTCSETSFTYLKLDFEKASDWKLVTKYWYFIDVTFSVIYEKNVALKVPNLIPPTFKLKLIEKVESLIKGEMESEILLKPRT